MPVKGTTTQIMPPKLRLKLANESENLLSKVELKPTSKEHRFYLIHSKQVSKSTYDKLAMLFESLMREMYEQSSWGWNREEKLSEWKHPKTRIMIVTKNKQQPCDATATGPNQILVGQQPKENEDIIGFMCFRYEIGSNKSECAFYVYEIHVDTGYQRQGLGNELMQMARVLAISYKMDKIMLTVFRSNRPALEFYKKLNFYTDKSSPAKDEADYIILSSKLKT